MRKDVVMFLTAMAVVGAVLAWLHFAWLVFWVGFCLWLGLVEFYLELRTGRTLSERFGEALKSRPLPAVAALIALVLFVAALIVHLLAMR